MQMFQFLEVGRGWYWVKNFYQTFSENDFRLQSQDMGGVPNLGHNPKFFLLFLVTPPLTDSEYRPSDGVN